MTKKIKRGKVISILGTNTIKVEVIRSKAHPLYKKQYKLSKNYLVHNNGVKLAIDDQVEIEEVSPISKRKRWKVTKTLEPV